MTAAQANENKNAMAKELYSRTFDWIVSKINALVNETSEDSSGMIGILDIFGFEIFAKNSFEQLCINLANEALQQHFNFNIFRVEMDIYRAEEVPIPNLVINDNQDVLDLLMKRPLGVIPILDEEGVVPRGEKHMRTAYS
jgi:myosin V